MINSYKDLIVWQKAIQLSLDVYSITKGFPKEELYGIISQMRRAAISIPSNIAEGRCRGSKKEFVQFLRIAHGSLAELSTQSIIAKSLGYMDQATLDAINDKIEEMSKMITSIIKKLKANS